MSQPTPPVPIETSNPPTPASTPMLEQVAIGDPRPPSVYTWKCQKGHVAPMIGMVFSAALLGDVSGQTQARFRDRKFCFVCLVEAFDKLGVSEVERVE